MVHNSKIISIYDNIILEKGHHVFNLEIEGNMICNCPSYHDGYQQTRYFFGWIENNKNNNNNTVTKNKIITKNIKLNNIFIPYLSIITK